MKTTTTYLISLLLTGLSFNANAQTVTTNPETWATLIPSGTCTNCTITIPTGFTLNLASTGTCTGCTFTGGGTVNVTAAFKFPTSVTTFKNLTVNFNSAPGSNYNLAFTNDSVVFNSAVTWSNGVTEISSSNIGVNAALKFQSADLISDSIWLNNNGNISFSNTPDSAKNTYIAMANGSSISFQTGILTGSKLVMNGNAAITSSNDFDFSSGKVIMNSTASLTVKGNLDVEGSVINMNGNSNMTLSNNVIFGTGTDVTIGDGTGAGAANIVTKSNLNITGNSLMAIAPGGNFLQRNNANFTNDHGSVTLPAKTVTGCATLNNTGYQTCVSLAVANMTLSAANAGAGKVALSWSDNEATAADHYLVQRNSGDNSWSTIATIPAGGYSNGDYRYTDDAAPSGTIDYRIIWVNADGKTLYSPVSAVTVTAMTAITTIGIHPNPAVGGRFYLSTTSTEPVIVNIFTSTGQQLLHTELQGQTQYPIQLRAQDLTFGVVIVQTISNNTTRAFTVLVR